MSLMNLREPPLGISPILLHLEHDYVGGVKMHCIKERGKEIENSKQEWFWHQCNNTYSSLREIKLENDDGIGPVKLVPRIFLQ